ncbi:helitron helicase-like domain-containing protein [Tanacetum coccineum]
MRGFMTHEGGKQDTCLRNKSEDTCGCVGGVGFIWGLREGDEEALRGGVGACGGFAAERALGCGRMGEGVGGGGRARKKGRVEGVCGRNKGGYWPPERGRNEGRMGVRLSEEGGDEIDWSDGGTAGRRVRGGCDGCGVLTRWCGCVWVGIGLASGVRRGRGVCAVMWGGWEVVGRVGLDASVVGGRVERGGVVDGENLMKGVVGKGEVMLSGDMRESDRYGWRRWGIGWLGPGYTYEGVVRVILEFCVRSLINRRTDRLRRVGGGWGGGMAVGSAEIMCGLDLVCGGLSTIMELLGLYKRKRLGYDKKSRRRLAIDYDGCANPLEMRKLCHACLDDIDRELRYVKELSSSTQVARSSPTTTNVTYKSHKVLGIAPVAIIDRQLPFEYTITSRSTDVVVMAQPVQNINHSAFRSMFEREKLSGNNFNDWFRQLKLVLRVEKKMFVIEQPLPAAPAADSDAQVLSQWNAIYDAYNEVACLILGSMTPELHRQFENSSPYDMIKELKAMFEKQAGVERFDLIQTFHACKQEEGKPVAAYVIQMKGYVDQLERLGYMLPQDLIVGLILNVLTKDFAGFGLPKKAETPQVMMIKGGKIQKAKKKSLKAKGKGKANGKGNDKQVYIPKPKNPKPSAKEHPDKDDTYHHCKEVGHWKRNCPVYLAKLLKKKKQVGSASSSGIFTIELFAFPDKSWVYDTGCGMDKSKITRKQSKAGKHGHENQKSTKPKPRMSSPSQSPIQSPLSTHNKPQGPVLQLSKVLL